MNRYLITGGVVVTPHESHDPGYVAIEGESVKAVGPMAELPESADHEVIDAAGAYVVPGFVDTHVHGRLGHNFGEGKEIARELCQGILSTGVTSLLPTVTAQPTLDGLLARLEAIRATQQEGPSGAEILGIHMEGPYFSGEDKARGSQPVANFRQPSVAEIQRFLEVSGGSVRKMSLAPELEGAITVIEELAANGVVVSLGHSAATFEQARAGIEAGASCATHTFNGMIPFHHRAPGLVGAVLTGDEVSAEVIGDGEHVAPAAIKLLLGCKGIDRVHLVTDNTIYAGLPDGTYDDPARNRTVVKEGNRAYVPGGTLTGSVGPMNASIRLLVEEVGCSLAEAIRLASLNPATVIGLEDRKGALKPGLEADLVLLEKDFEVKLTMVHGQVVYQRD